MKQSLVLGLAFMTSLPGVVRAQDTEWNRYTLEDLGGIHVQFEVADACEASGVTAALYEADVSLSLIESEVGVLTMDTERLHAKIERLEAGGGGGPFAARRSKR